jgi:hypothetical protein
MVGVSLNNPNKADDKEQLVETSSADVLVTVLVCFLFELLNHIFCLLLAN